MAQERVHHLASLMGLNLDQDLLKESQKGHYWGRNCYLVIHWNFLMALHWDY